MPDSLAAALAELQQHLPDIPKTAEGQYGKYADLAVVSAAIMPLLGPLGLNWTAAPTMDGDRFVLRYRLDHVRAGNISGDYPLPWPAPPQQIGSAITYARRYALCSVVGLAPHGDDDDADSAQKQALDDAQRHAEGRMTQAQRQEHAALRDHGTVDPAKRQRDRPAAPTDDQWTMSPEGRPGSVTPNQLQRLGIFYTTLGKDDDARHADLTDRAQREITSATKLSYAEAQEIIRALEPLVKKAAK